MTRLPREGLAFLFVLAVTMALAVAAIVAGPFSIWNVAQVVWIAVLTIQWARGRYGRDKSLRDFFS